MDKVFTRNGIRYRDFGQVWSGNVYVDARACYTDNAIAHLLSIPVNWINDTLRWKIARIEARLWRVPEGGLFPRYTIMQLIYWMNLFIIKTSTHISRY